MLFRFVRVGEDDARVRDGRIGDPCFGPVESVAFAVTHGRGSHRRDVRARVRLRNGERADHLRAQEIGDEFLFLFFIAEHIDRVGRPGLHVDKDPNRAMNPGDLFGDQNKGQRAQIGTAVLLGDVTSVKTQLAHF